MKYSSHNSFFFIDFPKHLNSEGAGKKRLATNEEVAAAEGIASAMAECLALYTTNYGTIDPVVVMVVQPGEKNSFDQRHLQ